MSADPVGRPVRGAHDDVPRRLGAIDGRLHQITTQLYTMGKLLSQLDEIRSHLDTLTGSLDSGESIANGRVPRRDRTVSPRRGADHPESPRRATGWPSVERVAPDTQLPAASRSPTRKHDALGDEACPYCGTTTGVQLIAATSPEVQAWSCAACGTDWAISTVSPQPPCDPLATTVERLSFARSILWEVITLAGESLSITDEQLRDRLLALAGRTAPITATADGTELTATAEPTGDERTGHDPLSEN